ncbi:hypothetical protein VTI28DRAFT_273 [Corynascus sepedonium]
MESYNNFESQIQQQLERAGILEPDIFSATGPQAFPSQPAAPYGPPPGLHGPEFPSQTGGYAPRSYGYRPGTEVLKGFPPSFPQQAHEAGRSVNIVLPNGGTEAQSLLMLSGKVEHLQNKMQELTRGMQELTRAVMRSQEETRASLDSVKDGLDNFISSITVAEQQPVETPREAPGVAAQTA